MKLHQYIEKLHDLELQGSHKEEDVVLKMFGGHESNSSLDKDKFSETVNKLAKDIFSEGLYNKSGKTEEDFSEDEIEIGIKVEMEHTSNPLIAKRIALDHLSEREDYYSFGQKCGIFDELKDTSEAEIIPFPNPKAPIPTGIRTLMDRETFQEFVNEVYQLMLDYDMKYNEQLNQLWFNELYSLNCKEKAQ